MSDTLELPTHEENPVEDVDIELTEEELEGETPPEPDAEQEPETAADPGPEPEPEPKKKPRADNRVASALAKAEEAERRAAEAMARAEEAERVRQQSDRAMMFHYEKRLETDVASLKRQLTEAKAVGDSEAEIEAMTKLTDVQAELRGVKSWLGAEPAAEPERRAEPKADPKPAAPAAEQQVSYEPRTVAWIEQNEWFQPSSDNFDAEMYEEATLYAKRLERRLKAAGKAKDIGNDDYFADIDRHIREEFPDAFDDAPPQKRTPPMKRDANAVPVTRSANGGVAPNKNVVRLTADERRLAHSLAANGAIKNGDGSRPSPEQAEKIYAIQRMKQSKG
jgi:hypothetical protein